VPRSWRKSV